MSGVEGSGGWQCTGLICVPLGVLCEWCGGERGLEVDLSTGGWQCTGPHGRRATLPIQKAVRNPLTSGRRNNEKKNEKC